MSKFLTFHNRRNQGKCITICTKLYPRYSAFVYNEQEQICHLGNATIEDIEQQLAEDRNKQQTTAAGEDGEADFSLCDLFVLNPENMTLSAADKKPTTAKTEENTMTLDLTNEIPKQDEEESEEEEGIVEDEEEESENDNKQEL